MLRPKYDYLIVGAGLFGAVFAYQMSLRGLKCLVIDKSKHIGGNCYTESRDNINVHLYGPHIFHTNDQDIWNWVNRFAEFRPYKQCTKVNIAGKFYSFPINLLTMQQVYGSCVQTPNDAKRIIELDKLHITNPSNLEEFALSQVGPRLYGLFIEGYTRKQWGKLPRELPTSIIKRIPVRFNFDDNYFNDRYQGIPIGGYTPIIKQLLSGVEVQLNTDYLDAPNTFNAMANKVVYTGKIDQLCDYRFGQLEYRSLQMEHTLYEKEDYQGCSIVNYPEYSVPFTRSTEHKHFENAKSPVTWVTKEYPKSCGRNDIPYYPINDAINNARYVKYKEYVKSFPNIILGGRLAEYKYYDMHQVIASALNKSNDAYVDDSPILLS